MKNTIILLAFSLLAFSCEKVIHIDLNEANPRYVMEGNIIAGNTSIQLKISKTTSYFNPTSPELVNNAMVTISDGTNITPVASIGNGIYSVTNYSPQIGKTYVVKVDVEGNTLEANAVIPDSVSILTTELIDAGEVRFTFNDPLNANNYYRIKQFVNTYTENNNSGGFILDDFGLDGTQVEEFVFFGSYDEDQPINTINSGDTLYLELQHINLETYTFLSTLVTVTDGEGEFGVATPANPTQNWSNNGLGYLGGGSKSIRILVVP